MQTIDDWITSLDPQKGDLYLVATGYGTIKLSDPSQDLKEGDEVGTVLGTVKLGRPLTAPPEVQE